jgi:hypothetical protein
LYAVRVFYTHNLPHQRHRQHEASPGASCSISQARHVWGRSQHDHVGTSLRPAQHIGECRRSYPSSASLFARRNNADPLDRHHLARQRDNTAIY